MVSKLQILSVVSVILAGAGSVFGDNWVTGTEAGADNAVNINAKLAADPGTGTITINDASTILVDTADIINCTGIVISDANAAITFSDTRKIIFANADGAITFTGTGALTINGAFANAGFDFATTAADKTLTITSATNTLNSTTASNRILLGDGNTLKIVAGGSPSINSVVISGTATLDIDAAASFASVSNAGATLTTVDIDNGVTATIITPTLTTATTVKGGNATSVLAFTNAGTLSGTITFTGTGEIEVNGASTTFASLSTTATALTLDINADPTTFTVLNNTGATATTIDIASATTTKITTPNLTAPTTVNGGNATSVLAFTNAGTLSGPITFTGTGEIEVNGADTEFASLATTATALTLDINAGTTTFDALNNTGATATTIDIANDVTTRISTPTLTTATTVNGGNATSVLAFNDAGTFSGPITFTGTGEIEVNGANTTFTSLATTATALTLDINEGPTTFTALNNTGATATTIDIANATTAKITAPTLATATTLTGAAATSILELDGASTVANLTIAGTPTLDVDAATTITTFAALPANSTIDVDSGITLNATATVGANTLTLAGSGTLSRVDATTGTITDNGGSTVSDLRLTPGAGTFTWNGTGFGTITTLANSVFANGSVFNKTGTGSVTIASGLNDMFSTGNIQRVTINGGTLVVGSAGLNDDITFSQDGDEITVANGATLTTYGSFTVAVAGANVNVDAVAGSTVNLTSANGAETFTAVANNDFQLLGTVNITGANGDYTLGGAYTYQFGDVNITGTGSFIYAVENGRIEFAPGSTVDMQGAATLTLGSATDTNEVVVDTVGGVGTFTIDRGSSTNLTLNHVDLARAIYDSGTGCPAEADGLDLTNVDFTAGNVNWLGACPTGGGSPASDGATDGDEEQGDADEVGDGEEDAGEEAVTETSGPDGGAEVDNAAVDVTVEGLAEGSEVTLETDEEGVVTLTVADADGGEVLHLVVQGLGEGASIDVSVDQQGDQAILITDANGSTITLDLNSLPEGAEVQVQTDSQGDVTVAVTDESGEATGVTIATSGAGEDVTFTVTYNDAPDESAGRIVPGFPGFEDEEALGGSVTVAADGLAENSVVLVALTYSDGDLIGIDEADLRLYRLYEGTYVPPGPNDVGVSEPTGEGGDYGVDTAANSAWAEVLTLGTFAVGVPDDDLVSATVDGDQPTDMQATAAKDSQGCGAGAAPCGATGMVTWFMMMTGLVAMRRHRR